MAAPVPSEEEWFDWEGDQPLNIPLDQLIIYELHVRGFTRHPSAKVAAPGAAQKTHAFTSIRFGNIACKIATAQASQQCVSV